MGKITRHGGPSIEGADIDQDSGEITPLAETDEETAPAEEAPAASETPAAEQSTPDDAEQKTEQRPRRGRRTTE
ncbi:hypothetical protein ACFWFB_33815 [Streptomyces albidoflavus]